MIIGSFSLRDGSYIGVIHTLGGGTDAVAIRPQERGPDYLVTAPEAETELGAAWKRTSRERKPYLSVKLDSPFLAAPVNAALIEQEDGNFVLVWNRRRQAEPQAA